MGIFLSRNSDQRLRSEPAPLKEKAMLRKAASRGGDMEICLKGRAIATDRNRQRSPQQGLSGHSSGCAKDKSDSFIRIHYIWAEGRKLFSNYSPIIHDRTCSWQLIRVWVGDRLRVKQPGTDTSSSSPSPRTLFPSTALDAGPRPWGCERRHAGGEHSALGFSKEKQSRVLLCSF